MDISVADVRSWMTVVQFVVFLGIVWWAFGAARKGRFEEAAKLALEGDDPVVQTGARRGGQK